MYIRSLFAVVAMSVSSFAFGAVPIASIIVEGGDSEGRAYILSGGNPSAQCGAPAGPTYFRIKANTEKGRQQYSLALTAFSLDKKVDVAVVECDDWKRPIVDSLSIAP